MTEVSPLELLRQSATAFLLSRCLQLVAEIGVADALVNEPTTASTLAQATGSQTYALSRVLNFLATYGIFQRCDGGFSHTPASGLLRTDDPKSMRSFVRMFGFPVIWNAVQI
jgi:hypothetical protein